ncbi:DUF4871 domain-containing protein [Paenibacillus sp. J23TS9]|uniref:DUF4871 domain-containing protein n=1 Tax=Paenibacillus sp. J23TS9 TaxID=2807193 RepID=UPI001BD07D53|nr:DUF4871 domain-containing protein [Paenibacillus sp. J23TS9]
MMNNETKPQWYEQLKTPPFEKPMFTPQMEQQVLQQRLRMQKQYRAAKQLKATAIIGVAVVMTVVLILAVTGRLGTDSSTDLAGLWLKNDEAKAWEPHSVYMQHSTPLIEAIPGGDYQAGNASSCYWLLNIPYEQLQQSTIQITATERNTGMAVTELPETAIDRTMSNKDSIRFGSDFALPFAGTWRFDVMIDGQKKGDVVFDIPDSDWQIAPDFEFENSVITGKNMRMGYVSSGFTAGKPNKFLWHLFNVEKLAKQIRVNAVKQGSTDVLTLLETRLSGSEWHKTLPSSMQLPESGLWRLLVYVDDKFFDSMIVVVKEP